MRRVGLRPPGSLLVSDRGRTVLHYPSHRLPTVNLNISLRVTPQLLSTQNLPVSRDSNDFSPERYVSR